MGIAYSRNEGVQNSTEDWICFIDSDDWIDPFYIEILMEYVEGEEEFIDFVVHERIFKNEKSILSLNCTYNSCYFDNKYLQNTLWHHKITPTWSKCFNKKFLEKIKFDENQWAGEDIIHWLKCVNKVNKFKICPEKIYNYIPNDKSISKKAVDMQYIENIIEEARTFIKEHPDTLGKFNNYITSLEKVTEEIK